MRRYFLFSLWFFWQTVQVFFLIAMVLLPWALLLGLGMLLGRLWMGAA